jgi:radical SAM superfamily enzyme YgiQ (UPF0313 family)
MKILLVSPQPAGHRGFFSRLTYPSLTLQQVAACTPREHEVSIVDERFEDIDFGRQYDVVGISCLTYNSIRGYEIAARFRKQGAVVVFGGYHASLLPDEVKQHADAVVIGEAELTWPEVLKDVVSKCLKPFYRAPRLVEPAEIPAARHDIGVYHPFTEAMQVSRGCPTGCEFCAMQVVEGTRFRGRPVDHLIAEMESIKAKSIFFADASLTINPPYSKKLFAEMRHVGKSIECFGNMNVLARDDELLKAACEAGVSMWYVGVESITQENITQAGKSTNKVEDYGKAIKKIKDHGMMVTGFFMFGFDHDTPGSFQKTLDAIHEWGLDEISLSIVTPYPGTRLFDRLDREGRILTRDWSRYDEGKLNFKLENMSEKEFRAGMRMMAEDYFSYTNIFDRAIHDNGIHVSRLMRRFFGSVMLRSFYLNDKLKN